MATKFKGYLLKFGNTIFPNEYLAIDKCTSTPNTRVEIEAYRDDYTQNLTRVTAPGKKTKEEYYTKDDLTLEDKITIQNIMKSGLIDELQRKYHVTFWNDETNSYQEADIYIPDITYTRKQIDEKNNTIIYESIKIATVEY